MTYVNPYELLGVTETSTKDEVRRAYYKLAMIVHPDKGGYAADMNVLHAAYEWVINHIHVVTGREGGHETYEEKEEAFQKFLDKQLSHAHKVLTIDEIKKDVTEFQDATFDALFAEMASPTVRVSAFFKQTAKMHVMSRLLHELEFANNNKNMDAMVREMLQEYLSIVVNTSVFESAIEGGYADRMEESMPYEEMDVTQPPISQERCFGKQEIQVYKEPEAIWAPPSHVTGCIGLPKKLEDYTLDNMTDYVKAFQDPTGALSTWEAAAKEQETRSITEALDAMVLERKMADLGQEAPSRSVFLRFQGQRKPI